MLLRYDYSIIYKTGKGNIVANALSRQFDGEGQYFGQTALSFTFLDPLKQDIRTIQSFRR